MLDHQCLWDKGKECISLPKSSSQDVTLNLVTQDKISRDLAHMD